MESVIIWVGAFLIAAIIFIPYVLKFHRKQKIDHERKKEAISLGADKPMAQYPQIDEMRCIGCGACVMACPEGDVLGIVFGKATVINGLKCVGHARCSEACPVQGIVVGLGDVKKRDDIPYLNEYNETNLPGIYIAGELGGLALIRNAISQGSQVANNIAATITRSTDPSVFDVVIVGAGPAGTSTALSAKKNNLSYLVLDQQGLGGTILQYPRKKLVMTRPIEIPLYGMLDKPEYSKEELLDIWHDIHGKQHLNLRIGEKLQSIQKEDGCYLVKTERLSFRTQAVVLALGRRGTPRKLNVPGEDLSKVMYKLTDAESFANNHVLVVGGGDSAVEAAIGLALQTGNTVTLSYRKANFFRLKKKNDQRIHDLIKEGKIRILFNSNVTTIRKDSVNLKIGETVAELRNDFVFIFAGGEPPFQLLRDIGIRFGGEQKKAA